MLIHISFRFLLDQSPSIALSFQSVLLLNFAQIVGYVKVVWWISKLLHGFVKIDTWISLSCSMYCQTKPRWSLTNLCLWQCFNLSFLPYKYHIIYIYQFPPHTLLLLSPVLKWSEVKCDCCWRSPSPRDTWYWHVGSTTTKWIMQEGQLRGIPSTDQIH